MINTVSPSGDYSFNGKMSPVYQILNLLYLVPLILIGMYGGVVFGFVIIQGPQGQGYFNIYVGIVMLVICGTGTFWLLSMVRGVLSVYSISIHRSENTILLQSRLFNWVWKQQTQVLSEAKYWTWTLSTHRDLDHTRYTVRHCTIHGESSLGNSSVGQHLRLNRSFWTMRIDYLVFKGANPDEIAAVLGVPRKD